MGRAIVLPAVQEGSQVTIAVGRRRRSQRRDPRSRRDYGSEHATRRRDACRKSAGRFMTAFSTFWELHAVVSEHINASADRVRGLYEDPDNWARLFPATIRGARVVHREEGTTVVEVDHVEGLVMNILHDISPMRIDMAEIKRHYEATFTNEFVPEEDGMRYRLTASVRLRWPYRLAAPFVTSLVIAKMRRYVVQPLKAAAETEQ